MNEEAADELVGWQRHYLGLVASLGPVVFPFEGDAGLVEGDEAGIGDGDAMGVAGEIGEHRLGAAERALGIDNPFGLAERRQIFGEGFVLGERRMIGEETQAPGLM